MTSRELLATLADAAQKPHSHFDRKWLIPRAVNSLFWMPEESCQLNWTSEVMLHISGNAVTEQVPISNSTCTVTRLVVHYAPRCLHRGTAKQLVAVSNANVSFGRTV